MSTLTTAALPVAESYVELLHSRSHWLFELTLELVSAPLAFATGWVWRNGLLRHLHRDLHALQHDGTLPCEEPAAAPPARLRETAPARHTPVPLSWFGMPFGLAGVATAWTYAAQRLSAPAAVGAGLAVLSGLAWALLLVAYVRRGSIGTDLQDPTAGPFSALVLLTPLLLTAGALGGRPALARPVFDVLTGLVVVLAGWLTGQWIVGPIDVDRLHPGYFLPSVGGGYVAAAGASALGQPLLAQVAFGLASVSWLVLGALVLGRLMVRPALPDALVPTLAIQVAPPALASVAWFALNGGRVDAVAAGLLGYGLLMLVAQLRLLPTYRRLAFGPSAWGFTFPVAAVGTAALHWLAVAAPAGATAWSALVLTGVTLPVALVGARTLVARRGGELRPPAVLVHAGSPRSRAA